MKKSEKIQLAYLIIYFLCLITLLGLMFVFPNIYVILSFVGVLLFGYIGMYIVKTRVNVFKCRNCNHTYHTSLKAEFKERFSHDHYEHIMCPKCGNDQHNIKL